MPPRRLAAGSYTVLEWGQATSQPRSAVFDSCGAMVFTGSRVRPVDGVGEGTVLRLVDRVTVEVAWDGPGAGGEWSVVGSAALTVVAAAT